MTHHDDAASYLDMAEVRAKNRELDAALLDLIDRLDRDRLDEPEEKQEPGKRWTARIVLGHLSEFPAFFARELRIYLEDPNAPIARNHEHPERLAAIAASSGRSYDELVHAIRESFAELDSALAALPDDALDGRTNNRHYGDEPLSAFFDRYVIGHKAGHLRQLGAMPAAQS